MSTCLKQPGGRIRRLIRFIYELWLAGKSFLHKLFNKNIYTRVLFTNITVFVIGIIALMIFSGFLAKQITYDQVQQDLLRKAKRVNFALLQQTDSQGGKSDAKNSYEGQDRKELLRLLADIFDTRITIFNREGNIIATSEEQEVVPGSKAEKKFVEILSRGETEVARTVEQETGQITFTAVVPMGNNEGSIENGILLETKASNLDIALNKMRLYLVIGDMAILVILSFVSVYLAMHISRPISRLATTVAEMSRGSDVMCVEDQPLDEINLLATQLNKLAIRIKEIQDKSRRIDEEKALLFGEISHELRTPLTSVQGFVEAIRDGMVQDEALMKRYLDTIYTQTLHIARLVDDILALSRLESGYITVEKLPLDLIALAQGVVMSMETAAQVRNNSILLEKKTEKAVILGDVDRMEQIIRNLLKNAIKATENGTVRVCVEIRKDEVILTVEDNGIGISSEELPRIWDRFYRVKNQRVNQMQEKESGLGLVIVKKLVQLHGGSINVESQLGKGTVFNLSFPHFDKK